MNQMSTATFRQIQLHTMSSQESYFVFVGFHDHMAAVNVRLILRLLVPMAFALTIMTLIRCIEFVTKFPKQFQYRTFFIFNRSNIPLAVINKKSHSDGELGCKVPTLDPFLPVIMKSLQPREPIKCNGRLYTEYENNVLRLLDDISEGLSRRSVLRIFFFSSMLISLIYIYKKKKNKQRHFLKLNSSIVQKYLQLKEVYKILSR